MMKKRIVTMENNIEPSVEEMAQQHIEDLINRAAHMRAELEGIEEWIKTCQNVLKKNSIDVENN